MQSRMGAILLGVIYVVATGVATSSAALPVADRKAAAWVRKALAKMTLDEKVAQLVVPGLNGVYLPTDSNAQEKLERLVPERRVGDFHVFGGGEALPPALLNSVYGL